MPPLKIARARLIRRRLTRAPLAVAIPLWCLVEAVATAVSYRLEGPETEITWLPDGVHHAIVYACAGVLAAGAGGVLASRAWPGRNLAPAFTLELCGWACMMTAALGIVLPPLVEHPGELTHWGWQWLIVTISAVKLGQVVTERRVAERAQDAVNRVEGVGG